DDATCGGAVIFSSTVPVSGNGDYSSASYTANQAGTYRWVASYSGDGNKNSAATACKDANESVVVTKASPAISTTASASVAAGGPVSDTAHLTSRTNPRATPTRRSSDLDDATCGGAVIFSSTVPVSGNGDYSSASYTANQAGTYRWVASYSGDGNNNSAATACNDANESVVVTKASPAITTTASGSVAAGGQISDVGHLTSGTNPSGTITFNLYGPDDATCGGAVIFSSTVPVSGNGDYSSASFTANQAGTYRWVASYSGDSNNNSAATACNDANESVVVTKKTPTLTTTAS